MQWADVLEILKYTVPSVVVFLTAYLLLKLFLDGERERKELEVRAARYKDSLPIRLQAYERLTLFLERINPTSLLQRVNKPGMSALELQRALIVNIRVEFEHNLSQQIYVSPEAWMQLVQVKEELISIINRVASELPDTATGKDLARALLEYFIKTEAAVPTQRALDTLKAEVKKIY
ncbi:MAG: hypothetical protein NZL95_02265 [Chitinophagales bacterium]|nr:hypothetical protein [Chitinophagales bacterium]MDW8427357.1 hypothetical protein [Chitinophagales bacterium]